MWLDVIGLVILGAFMVVGLFRGTLASFLRILSLLFAYGVAVWAAKAFGPGVAERFLLPRFLGIPLTGAIAFVAAYAAFGLISLGLQIWERRQRKSGERTPLDHVGGAVLGGVQGLFVLLLIGWLGLWVDAGRAAGTLQALPDTSDSALTQMSQSVLSTGAGVVVDDDKPGARMAVQMVTRPKDTLTGMRRIMSNPRIEGLQSDALFWSYVEKGAYEAALNRGSFLGIAHDDTLRNEFAAVGVIDEYAAADPRLFRNAVHEVLEEVSPRIRGLKNDPALRELLKDPAIVAALEAGDSFALLQNARFREVVGRVLEGPESEAL